MVIFLCYLLSMRFVANGEIRIGGNRNFALVKPCQFHFLGNPHWNNLVKNLKEDIHDGKNKDDVGHNADKLGDKLGCVAIKQPFDRSRHTVEIISVGSVRKKPKR